MITIKGNPLVPGKAVGPLLVTLKPISFLGMVDPVKGEIVAGDTDIMNRRITGTVLAFPHMIGSTVAPYIIYRMKKLNTSPAAIVVKTADASLASGCAVSGIPLIDHIDLEKIVSYNMKLAVLDGESGELNLDDKIWNG
jgi:predicted aconitase with swiveling domain